MIVLKDSSLLKNKALINDEWVKSSNDVFFDVINPFDQERLGQVPDMNRQDAHRAIQSAYAALDAWRDKTAEERAAILEKWFALIIQNKEDLAQIITAEQGKPIRESRSEVEYGASFIKWFAEEGKRVYGDVIPGHAKDKRILVIKQAVGVVGIITPWNFPIAMITRKLGAALAAGCTTVVKPAEDTPLSALAIASLAHRAGLPAGVLNIITTKKPEEIGQEFCSNSLIRKLSFTGSTEVGKHLMAQCTHGLKKVSLELGGNAPFIVFEDADLNAAVQGLIDSKFRNAGQTCICANRIFVQDPVYAEFIERLRQAMQYEIVGPGSSDQTTIGPLINMQAVEKVKRLQQEAVERGACIILGGDQHELGGTFYEPTIITDLATDMQIYRSEIFGPIAAIYRFYTEPEVIEMANHTSFGLAAYFYANDMSRVWRVAESLEYGMVGINTGMISTAVAPFGGIKESGIGREGSKYGMEEYLETKYICLDIKQVH